MAERFIRCQLCGIPHPADVRECPIHRKPIVAAARMDVRPSAPPTIPPPLPSRVVTPPPLPSARAQASPASLVGKLLAGRYRVTGVIASGGMGVVYDGLQVALGRRVAIKCLHPRYATDASAIARFQNEAMVSGSFGHPHIVEVFDLGWLDDERSPFLVMERLDGETLGQRLQREKKLGVGLVLTSARQVLSALVATHARGILHRDLKPDNVFLVSTHDGGVRAKVLDFGLSKAIVRGDSAMRLTRSGVVMGTPSYMPPEQATGEPDLDGRVDLYALGMILYETLTGRLPYSARTPAALMIEIRRTRPAPPRLLRPDVPAVLDAAVMKALSPDRTHRFADALEMQRALSSLALDDEDDPTTFQGPPTTPSPTASHPPDPDSQPMQHFARKV
jgi:eukaryotic-like serine/threonine-protein kinase